MRAVDNEIEMNFWQSANRARDIVTMQHEIVMSRARWYLYTYKISLPGSSLPRPKIGAGYSELSSLRCDPQGFLWDNFIYFTYFPFSLIPKEWDDRRNVRFVVMCRGTEWTG
jgi:hypothetical protein